MSLATRGTGQGTYRSITEQGGVCLESTHMRVLGHGCSQRAARAVESTDESRMGAFVFAWRYRLREAWQGRGSEQLFKVVIMNPSGCGVDCRPMESNF